MSPRTAPLSLFPVAGLPAIKPGDDLGELLFAALDTNDLQPEDGDVLVICQKVVSKAEERIVDLRTVEASPLASSYAATWGKDPRIVELVLRESTRIVRMERGHLIVETGPGWVCANAGIDASNTGGTHHVVLLPRDPDAAARELAEAARRRYGQRIAVLITDTFGRPWREGVVDFALGVAGMDALHDLRGQRDLDGRELAHTVVAQADALAAAAGLLMRKDAAIPAVLVRGGAFAPGHGSGRDLLRAPDQDLFR